MKKMLKRVTAALLVAMFFVAGVPAIQAKAAGNEVVINVKDEAGWGSMLIYNWGDNGETAGVWPGTEMTALGDDWYTFTITTECDLHIVLCSAGGADKTSDIDAIAKDAGEIWAVVKTAAAAKDTMGGSSGAEATIYTVAEEGWPTSAAAVTEVTTTEVVATDATVTTTDATVTTTEATLDATPKTGDTAPILPIVVVGLGSLLVTAVVLTRKKELSI